MTRLAKRGLQSVAIAASIILIPTIVLAATGTFTSNTRQSAVVGLNTSGEPASSAISGRSTGPGVAVHYGVSGTATGLNGVGVQGTGNKYGLFSNGDVGVSAGKQLVCSGCVTSTDTQLQPGETESGVYAAAGYSADSGDYLGVAINFPRPLARAIPDAHVVDTDAGASPHCPAIGRAAPGYLCLYPAGPKYHQSYPASYEYTFSVGVLLYFVPSGTNPYVGGVWSLTAP